MARKLSVIIAITMLTLLVAACGGKKTTGESQSPASSAPAASSAAPSESSAAPAEVTEIQMLHWNQANINAAIEEINAGFEKEFPQYKVVYSKTEPDDPYKQAMRARLTAGDLDIFPDLSAMRLSPQEWSPGANVPYWQEFIDNGLIADLSNEAFVKNYDAGAIAQGGTYKGKVYAIPTGSFAMGGFIYNKKMFEDNGLKVPTTWSEFTALGDAFLAKKITPIGMAGKDVWPLKLPVFNLQNQILGGGDQMKWIEGVWKGTNKYNDAEALEVLEKMKLIQDKYTIDGFLGIGYGDLAGLLTSGKVAMIADGSWDITTIQTAAPDLDIGYFPLPATDKPVDKMAGKYDMTWYVAESGPNKAGAVKWLEYFSRTENYAKFVKASGLVPIQPGVATGNKVVDEYVIPWMPKLVPAYELVMINRVNIGETLASEGVHTELIAKGGPYKTAKDLADAQQKQWEAAAPK
jgi:raffinose/stachyose/melibiose transport system substrate-binding protein